MSVHNVESENQNVSHPNASVEDINEQNIQQSSPAVRATDGSSCSASDTCEVSREQRDATITANQLPSTSRGSAEYPRDSPHNYSNEGSIKILAKLVSNCSLLILLQKP